MSKPIYRKMIPETYVHVLYDYLEAKKIIPDEILKYPRPQPLTNALKGISIELWEQLLSRAAIALADPMLGLHLGQKITPRHLGVLGYVLLACDNLASALEKLEKYQRLIFDVIPMITREGPDWVELVWDTTLYKPDLLVDETGITVIMQFCRSSVQKNITPIFVQFMHDCPDDLMQYEQYFGCPVLFNQSETVIRISKETLELPIKTLDPSLLTIIEQHANQLLEQLPKEEPIIEAVRKAIAHQLPHGEPTIELIAEKLCLSPRTLQRKLQNANTNFRNELNIVRQELADSYLKNKDIQIADIALMLGYSEHSAFTRAYKAMTGVSPQQSRDQVY